MLYASVASTNTVAAEHDEVSLDIIARVLGDVMERETVGSATQRTFTPPIVKLAE